MSDETARTPIVEFFIPGIPKPGGSKRFFGMSKAGKAIIADDCKNADWKNSCKAFAMQAYQLPPVSWAIAVTCTFHMPRPKYHFKADGSLSPKFADAMPTKKPDATKLFRSTEDALTGILWVDDALIVQQHITKRYTNGGRPGALIRVEVAR